MNPSKLIPIAFVLVFLILACGQGTAATEPPAGPADTAVPPAEPTATEPPTAIPFTPTPELQQYFSEDFQGNSADNWSYFLRSGDESKFSLESTNDGLLFSLKGTGIFSYLVYDPFEYDNVRMDVTVENRGVNDNNITLFCRFSEEAGWYEFNVYSSGLYDMLFTKPDSAGNLNYGVIAEGGSNKINMGHATNTYSLVCGEDSLIVYINDVETRKVGIPAYVLSEGQVGVSVSSFGQVPVEVVVKEIRISQP
jgi:hypothetical protein